MPKSLHGVQRRIDNHNLNSTTAGDSTIQNFAAEASAISQTTSENPNCQIVSPPATDSQTTIERTDESTRGIVQTLLRGQMIVYDTKVEEETDLERNETQSTIQAISRPKACYPVQDK